MQYKRRKDIFWKLAWCSVIWNYSLWVQGEGQGGISTPSILWTVTNDLSLSIRHSIFWIGGIHFSVFRKWQNWNLSLCRRSTYIDSFEQTVHSQSSILCSSTEIVLLLNKFCSSFKKLNTGLLENDKIFFEILASFFTSEK